MRTIGMGAVALSVLALAACATRVDYDGFEASSISGPPLKAVTVLDCPDAEGALTRISRAADGRSCDYRGSNGQSVRLSLLSLDGRSAADALAPSKAALHDLVPLHVHRIAPVSQDEPGEHANIDLPFFHIHTAGDRADVRIFGVTVHSDGDNADVKTHIRGAQTVVHANSGGAEVITEDVGRTNASLVYVLASDKRMGSGYRVVGYVARGPVAGPLVVGEFRAADRAETSQGRRGGGNDLDRLIDRNVKG